MKYLFTASILAVLFLLNACNSPVETKKNESLPKFNISLTHAEKAESRLSPEILWKFGRVGEAQLSPDGKHVIYTVTYYDIPTNKKKTNIFRVTIESGDMLQLTHDINSEFNIRWINNGQKIAFISTKSGETQIWEMNIDGSNQIQVSTIEGGINSFEYAPVGNNIFYTKDVKLDETPNEIHNDLPLANVKIMDDLMYRHWNDWHDYKYSHIFVAKFEDNQLINHKDIMEDERWDSPLSPWFDNTQITWSPDGKTIAYTCKKMFGREYAISTNSDIFLYNTESGKTENITDGMPGYDKYPVFSPDGSKIAFQSMEAPGYESDKERLFIYDIISKQKDYITKNFDQNAANYIWTENGKEIYFISGINATYQVYKLDVASNQISQLTKGTHNYQSIMKAGDVMIGKKMSMSMASEVFQINLEDGSEKQLTFTNKNIYDNIEMGKVEEHWIKTVDGKDMLVWLILPPKFDPKKKYPTLLYCQGGPQSAVSQFFSFRWNFQIMAANDYVIIAPNRRGLPTFGEEWNEQISGDYSGLNIQDYLQSVDHFKKKDFIDEDNIGAIGASYGGYSVFYLAGNHDGRFKTFISHCGIYNFEAMYASTEETFFVHHDLGGAFWDEENKIAQKSYAFSPHKFVGKWDTPIMIITSGKDFRIPYTQSLEAFNAAQLRGIPSKLLYFPEESHFVLKPQNSILWQREYFAWLDKWLK